MNITDMIETADYYLLKGIRIAAVAGLGFLASDLAPSDAYARPKPTITTGKPAQAGSAQKIGEHDVKVSIPDVIPQASQPSPQPDTKLDVKPAAKGPGVYLNNKLVKRQPTPEEKAALARAQRDAKAASEGKMPYCDVPPAACSDPKMGKYNLKPKDCDSYEPRGRYYAGTVQSKPVVDFTNDKTCLATDPRMNWRDWLNGYGKHVKKGKGKIPATTGVGNAPPVVLQPAQPAEPAQPTQPAEPFAAPQESAPAETYNPWSAQPAVLESQASAPQRPNAVSLGYKQIIRGNDKSDTYLVEVGYDRTLGRFIVGARALVGAQYPNVSDSTPKEKGQTVPNPQSLDQMFSREYAYKSTSEGKGMLDTFGVQAVAGLNVYKKDDGSFGIDVLLKGGAVAVLTETENRDLVQAVQFPNNVLSQRSAPTGTNNETRLYPDLGGEVRFNLDKYFLGAGGGVVGLDNPQGSINANAGFRF